MPKDKPNISSKHQSYQSQQKRKQCPGCGDTFVPRHFEVHKLKQFIENEWKCRKSGTGNSKQSKTLFEDTPVHLTCEAPTTSGGGNNTLGVAVTRQIRKSLKQLYPGQEDEDEADEEIWVDVDLGDIDVDFMNSSEEREDVTGSFSPGNNLADRPFMIFRWPCLFLCSWQSAHLILDTTLGSLLAFLFDFFNQLTAEKVFLVSTSVVFTRSVYMLYKNLGLKKDNFTKYVICRKCYALYNFDDCTLIVEGQKQSKRCSNILYPNHTQRARRGECGELLLKTVKLTDGSIGLYPFKTYCYKPLEQSLEHLVSLPDFQLNCEKWRKRPQNTGVMTDIYDGKIWKEFQSPLKANFLNNENNFGIMLNLDWFQPFEHVNYSVGVMYAVVLNLPRQERFKLKNVLLLGIIPDIGGEPQVPSFITPLVNELDMAWNQGFSLKSHKNPNSNDIFKIALMCVGCDIPATRKLCGFLGHSAILGCSKCSKHFPGDFGKRNYAGFDTENWIGRNLAEHRNNLTVIRRATTKTERERLESLYGLRYSPLWDLEYFDPIRMSIIDPMHNFYQGTAKRMVKLWLELDILDNEQLKAIQERVDAVDAASNIGSIPRKIASSFGGFTADQWKNWTNIFSIFALVDILPRKHLEIWRKFVLASKLISSKIINEAEIRKFELLIVQFCSEFEKEYGECVVTPNMHLHCHMADCIRDYGPVYSFWLFSFERYNGHLGSLPNNNKSIEIQIMRRFTRDSFINSIDAPSNFKDIFVKHFEFQSQKSNDNDNTQSEENILKVMYLSKKSAPIKNQDWQQISIYQYKKKLLTNYRMMNIGSYKKCTSKFTQNLTT